MEKSTHLSASLLLYKESPIVLQKIIACFLAIDCDKKLYILDNSPTNQLKIYCDKPAIEYVFFNCNTGFAKAHNWVIKHIANKSNFHLILNPDIFFKPQVIPNLIAELNHRSSVAMIAPKVEYPNGDSQFSARKNPSLFELCCRRLHLFKNYTAAKEYRNQDLSKPFFPDFVYGCFMLFKTADFIAINGFDKRYFLYMEDADICRKIYAIDKKILYFPTETVIHQHRRGSTKTIRLLYYHLLSAIKYAKKW